MARNLVICLDGTNNKFGQTNTNVVRLYQALGKDPASQAVFYDPGVGTLGEPGMFTKLGRKVTMLMGLAFGLGVTANVSEAYAFLMDEYAEGDRIYIFGFSRGAMEARALAGLLHKCGLLNKGHDPLVRYAVEMHHNVVDKVSPPQFKATFSRAVPIHFLGLWDTVTSVGNVWSPITWPFSTFNPSVVHVRHAIAMDERRAFFRQNRWSKSPDQDVDERWFAGVHSDVGGGYPVEDSILWQVAFKWMAEEAETCRLILDSREMARILSLRSKEDPSAPAELSAKHDSMKFAWMLTEVVPKPRMVKDKITGEFKKTWIWPIWHWIWTLPKGGKVGRARTLQKGDRINRSVLERYAADACYRPESLTSIGITDAHARAFLAEVDGQGLPKEYYEVKEVAS